MVIDGHVAYMTTPFATSGADDEDRWVKTELDEASTDQLMQFGMAQDPAATRLGESTWFWAIERVPTSTPPRA